MADRYLPADPKGHRTRAWQRWHDVADPGMSSVRQREPTFLWAGEAAGRGKVSDQCLWAACKAMTTGLVLIVIGASMATVGFYSDHLSTVEERRGNSTVRVKNENRDRHLDSLTYLGPLVMGLGGFIIVATCVMTFEARDTSSSSAKLVSAWFKRSRSYVAPRPEISCQGTSVSDVSWERFLPGTRHDSTVTEADRSAVTSALISFSKNLQSSFESGRLPGPGGAGAATSGGAAGAEGSATGSPRDRLHRCQSDPNVVGLGVAGGSPTFREAPSPTSPLRKREDAERECFLKPPANPQLLRPRPFNLSPHDYRKVVSVDCASPPVLEAPTALGDSHPAQSTSSHGSMAMDVYLPEGAVTLKVKTKKHQRDVSPTATAVTSGGGAQIAGGSRKGRRSSGSSSRRLSRGEVGSGDSHCSTESDTSPRKSRTSTPRKSDAHSLRRTSTSASTSPRQSQSDVARSSVLTATKSATMKRHPFTRQKALDSHHADC